MGLLPPAPKAGASAISPPGHNRIIPDHFWDSLAKLAKNPRACIRARAGLDLNGRP